MENISVLILIGGLQKIMAKSDFSNVERITFGKTGEHQYTKRDLIALQKLEKEDFN